MGMSRMMNFDDVGLADPEGLELMYSKALGSRVVHIEGLHRLAQEVFAAHHGELRGGPGGAMGWVAGESADTRSGRPAAYIAWLCRFGNGNHMVFLFLRSEAKDAPRRIGVTAEALAELEELLGVSGIAGCSRSAG